MTTTAPEVSLSAGRERLRGVFFVVGAAIAWSAGGIGVKVIDAPGLSIAGFRSAFASLVLGAAFLHHARRTGVDLTHALRTLSRRPFVLGASASYALMLICYVVATKITTAANAVLLQYTGPIYVALLSWPLLRERLRAWDWLAVAGCVAGMALFFRDQVSSSGRMGDLIAVVSSFGFAALPLFLRLEQRRLEKGTAREAALLGLAPIAACLFGNLLTVAACLPTMVARPPTTAVAWSVLVPLGLVQIGVAYVLYGAGQSRLRAVETTLVCTLEPILSPVWVFLGTGERPTTSAILGGVLIVTAVAAQGVAAGMRGRAAAASM